MTLFVETYNSMMKETGSSGSTRFAEKITLVSAL
jgi:hypothetical protein